MVYDDWHNAEWAAVYDDMPLIVADKKILRKDIKSYLTPEFWSVLAMWQKIKQYGLPHGNGWANEIAFILDVTDFFNLILAKLQERDRKEKDAINRRITRNR